MSPRTRAPVAPIDRKEEILAEAERHFAAAGFAGASLSAIARAVGVGNPGLLYHFASKAALYHAVLERIATELSGLVADRLEGEVDPLQRLRGFILAQIEWIAARPTGFVLIQREVLDNAERVRTARRFPLRRYLETGVDVIAQAAAAGRIRRDVPPIVLLCIVVGSLSYADSARPTFAGALRSPELEGRKAWTELIGQGLLRLLAEPGAADRKKN